MQKFSLGLSDRVAITEYRRLFSEYARQIDYLYFSPYGRQYQTRDNIYQENNTIDYICSVLNLARSFQIKLELALNSYRLEAADIAAAVRWLTKHNIQIDAIVTLQKYLPVIRAAFPAVYLINSCNDLIRSRQAVDTLSHEFAEIVCGTGAIKNPRLWRYIRQSGFKVRLLLNSGCSFGCQGCANDPACLAYSQKVMALHGNDFLYALQSITPAEFHKYYKDNPFIDGFKLSTRSCEYHYIRECLYSYIFVQDPALEKQYIDHNGVYAYYLWQGFDRIAKNWQRLNYARVLEYKDQYWTKVLAG